MTDLSRRTFLLRAGALGVSAPALTMLAGCSGDDDGGFGDKPAGNSSPPAQKFKGQLVIGTIQNPPDPAKKALTDAYKKVQPDVELVWQTKDYDEVERYVNWLGTQLAAGEVRPDIVSGNYVPTFTGYLNFDEFRETVNPYTGNAWSADFDFETGRELNVAAQRHMLGTQVTHVAWFYNTELLSEAQVEPPTTWDEFAAVCAQLDRTGVTPVSANFQWQVPQWLTEIYFDQFHVNWVETIRAQEGDWNFDPNIDGKFEFDPASPNVHSSYTYSPQRFYQGIADGELRYDTPEMAAVVENFAKIFPSYAPKDFYVLTDQYTPFLRRQAAVMVGSSGDMSNLANDMEELGPERLKELGIKPGSVKPFEWDVFEMPAMEGTGVQCPPRSVEGSSGEYISVIDKDADQRQMAIDFLMFWLSAEGYQGFVDASVEEGQFAPGGPPRVQGVEFPSQFQDQFSRTKMLGNAEVPYNQFWTAGPDQETRTDLRNLFKDALDGKLSPSDYGSQLQSYVTDNLDRMLEASSLTRGDIEDPARRPESL